MSRRAAILRDLCLSLLFIAAGGRIIGSTVAQTRRPAEEPAAAIDRQVQAGRNTLESLLRILGEPSRRAAMPGPGRVEVLRFPIEQVERAATSLPLPRIDGAEPAAPSSASGREMCFEVSDGIVVRRWIEP